jgi:hypothetical protein
MGIAVGARRRVATAATWPLGMALTAFHYIWRILPVYRSDDQGDLPNDLPPPVPEGVPRDEIQQPDGGLGALYHRVYSCAISDPQMGAEGLIALLAADPNRAAPWQLARFRKTNGDERRMAVGDEFLVHMPGPWDGPVRTIEVGPEHFRLATLAGHLEAGQIEWRAWEDDGRLRFAVESWARAGDRLSALMHDRLRMAKEVQLYMWTSVVERAPRLAGGRLADGVHVYTRRVPPEAFSGDRR